MHQTMTEVANTVMSTKNHFIPVSTNSKCLKAQPPTNMLMLFTLTGFMQTKQNNVNHEIRS
jgi:hypothetical protein